MTRSPLRAVADDEKPANQKLKTILEASEQSRLEELKAMRRRIAKAMDDVNTPARDLAALSRRQLEIGREVEAIEVAEDEERSVVSNRGEEDWDADAI